MFVCWIGRTRLSTFLSVRDLRCVCPCFPFSTKCDDAIEADTLEVEELEAEREECCVEVLEEYQLMRNHEIDRLETQMCVFWALSLLSKECTMQYFAVSGMQFMEELPVVNV